MKFKEGDRVVVNETGNRDWRGEKATIVIANGVIIQAKFDKDNHTESWSYDVPSHIDLYIEIPKFANAQEALEWLEKDD